MKQELRGWCSEVLTANRWKNIAQTVSFGHYEGYDRLRHLELTVQAMFFHCFAVKTTDFSFQLRNS